MSDHVLTELRSLPHERGLIIKGDSALMRCPFHKDGQERTPSMSVLLVDKQGVPAGSFYCFGCQAKGNFNKLATKLALRPLTRLSAKQSTEGAVMQWQPDTDKYAGEEGTTFTWPDHLEWRGIQGTTLVPFGAVMVSFWHSFYMRLPVTLYGERMGHIDCTLEKMTGATARNYINSEGGKWASQCLFGFDQARKKHRQQPLWIVEGPRDCLSVWQAGCRAVAILGASNVTARKMQLIDEIAPPLVLIATDSDEAGDMAADRIRDVLGERHVMRRYVFKKRGMDPADLTPKAIRQIDRKALQSLNRKRTERPETNGE